MKFKRIIFVSIFIFAILAIGAVSANEDINATNENLELTSVQNDDVDVMSSNLDFEVDEDVKEDLKYEIDKVSKVCNSEEGYFSISISNEDVNGNIRVSVDDKVVYEDTAQWDYMSVPYSDLVKNSKMGSHTLKLDFYNDTIYKDFSESWKFDYTYYVLDEIPSVVNQYDSIILLFSDDVKGKLTLKIDNGKEKNLGLYSYNDIPLTDVKLGKHTYELKFTSSNTKTYKSFTKKGSYTLDYRFKVRAENDAVYGENVGLSIELPWDLTNNVSVSYNNQTKSYECYEELYVTLSDLKIGANKITVTYPGDKKYAKQTKTVTINVREALDVPSKVGFESGEGIYLKLPGDAKGNIVVTVDNDTFSKALNEGIANVDLSTYGMGKHNISVTYDGDDYKITDVNKTFKIVPNFIYPKKTYGPDGIEVSIKLPEDANGTLTIFNDECMKSVDVINGSGTVVLYGYKDYMYEFYLLYNNGNYNSYGKKISVYTFNMPPDSLDVYVPEIMVLGGYGEIIIFGSYLAEGSVNITLDGEYFKTVELYEEYGGYVSYNDLFKKISIGNHTIGFEYAGDDYYHAFNKTYPFAVDFYTIYVPDEVTDDDSSIRVYSDADGKFTCQVDGKEIKGIKYDDDEEMGYTMFDLKLPYGEHDVKIDFSGDEKYSKFTKEFKINSSYGLVEYGSYDDYVYGYSMELYQEFTAKLNGTATLVVGDKNYTVSVKDGLINTRIDDLPMIENITIIYLGDEKTPAKSFNLPITVLFKIDVPHYINRLDGGNITLKLPADAKGALEVKLFDSDGNLQFSEAQNVTSGEASIFVRELKLGHYYINARYTGDDYNVEGFDNSVYMIPKLTYEKVVRVGETSEFIFELPEDATGTLAMSVAGKKLTCNFVNGTAKIKVPGLKWTDDSYYYEISYKDDAKYGSYSSDSYEFNVYVNKWEPAIKVIPQEVIIQNNTFTVTFKLPSDAGGYIDIEEIGSKVKNGVGKVTTKVSKKGKVTLYYYYYGDDKYDEASGEFTIDVIKAPKLTMKDVNVYYTSKATFKVKVVDSYDKIVKGKYVTFYVNGKKVKSVKTDKKGYATIKLSKKPGTYNVKAVYKGGVTVKKLTVKHLVTLKTATVKKSAKKLVLKVTLKKGKKVLKWKKITFKFNGKKYTKWTNGKGIAKLTISKAVLKKLKVGKKVTYQATYSKDTVKKTATVKK